MLFTTLAREVDLLLTFTKTVFVGLCGFVAALMAGDAVFVFWPLFILG
jgi:hypothetical protein